MSNNKLEHPACLLFSAKVPLYLEENPDSIFHVDSSASL